MINRIRSMTWREIVVTSLERRLLHRVPWWDERLDTEYCRNLTARILGPERWDICLRCEAAGMGTRLVSRGHKSCPDSDSPAGPSPPDR